MENITKTNEGKEVLIDILEKEGYHHSFEKTKYYRYSIIKKNTLIVILGVKIPIFFPLKHSPPIELVNFHVSIGLSSRNSWVDEKFKKNLRNVATLFKKYIKEIKNYSHDFNFTGYRPELRDMIKKFYPSEDDIADEPFIEDILIKKHIRERFLRERDKQIFNTTNEKLSEDVLDIYKDFHLKPTLRRPPELFDGFPKGRENLVVIFKEEDPNQYLIEEPNSLSYWRDYQYKNVWTRTAVECLWPSIIYDVFQDKDYRLNYLFYDWIVYCRALVKPILELLNNDDLDHQEFQPFSEVKLLEETVRKREYPGVFLPQLSYECMDSEEIKPRNPVLFSSPPISLTEVDATNNYLVAVYLIRRNDLNNAKRYLKQAFKKLEKAHHSQGKLKILFKLFEISEKKKKYSEGIKILKRALKIAKISALDVDQISKIHRSLSRAYAMKGNSKLSEKHFLINLKFLESLPKKPRNEKLILDAHLEMVKLRINQVKLKLAKEHLKTLAKYIKKYPKYEFLFYYWRAHYEEKSENSKKKLKFLERADEIEDGPAYEHIKTKFDLGKHYLYQEGKAKNSILYLKEADNLIKAVDIEKLRLKIKIHEILKDAYEKENKENLAEKAKNQVESLREQLDRFN